LGLTRLINLSVPVLLVIYPVFIILILLSFFRKHIKNIPLVLYPASAVGFICGLFDAFISQDLNCLVPHFYTQLPFFTQGLAWITPCVSLIILGLIAETFCCKKQVI